MLTTLQVLDGAQYLTRSTSRVSTRAETVYWLDTWKTNPTLQLPCLHHSSLLLSASRKMPHHRVVLHPG